MDRKDTFVNELTSDKFFKVLHGVYKQTTHEQYKEFTQLSDDVARVTFMKTLKPALAALTCKHSYSCKSAEKATQLRQQGNVQFKKKDFADALRLYNESVLFSPVDNRQVKVYLQICPE